MKRGRELEVKETDRDFLQEIYDGKLVTCQKRTGKAKKYVFVLPPNYKVVLKGPYKERSETLEFRSCILQELGCGNFIPVDAVHKDSQGNYWYEFFNIGDRPEISFVNLEAKSMGNHAIHVADRSYMNVSTGVEIWKTDERRFEKNLLHGAMKTLLAMFSLGVGDIQFGGNHLFSKERGYWIDYEENTMRTPGTGSLGGFLFKNELSKEMREWMEKFIKTNREAVLKDIDDLEKACEGLWPEWREFKQRLGVAKAKIQAQ